jgi:hypothetical protein
MLGNRETYTAGLRRSTLWPTYQSKVGRPVAVVAARKRPLFMGSLMRWSRMQAVIALSLAHIGGTVVWHGRVARTSFPGRSAPPSLQSGEAVQGAAALYTLTGPSPVTNVTRNLFSSRIGTAMLSKSTLASVRSNVSRVMLRSRTAAG